MDHDLADFHNFLEKDFCYNAPGKTKRGVTCVGRQTKLDGGLDNVWVLNPSLHIDEMGNQIPLECSPYYVAAPYIETCYGKNSSKIDIKSTVTLPLESRNSLDNLLVDILFQVRKFVITVSIIITFKSSLLFSHCFFPFSPCPGSM